MDAALVVMWAELVVRPFCTPTDGPQAGVLQQSCVVWDNFRAHGTDFVTNYLKTQCRMMSLFLPANMTAELQPMDVTVNAVLKARIRKVRAEMIYRSFHGWAAERTKQKKGGVDPATLPDFIPPKSTLENGLITILETLHGHMQSSKMISSIAKTFIACGIVPNAKGQATLYKRIRATVRDDIQILLGDRKYEYPETSRTAMTKVGEDSDRTDDSESSDNSSSSE